MEKSIIDDYENGYGTDILAGKYKIHRATIQRCLKRNNIVLRRVSPYSHYNVHFFDQYTDDSCYWAGFILADGYIRDDRDATAIHLCNTDMSHLYKIRELVKYEGNISNSNKECSITFTGKWYKKALYDNYELTPRKAHTVKISDKIPKDKLCHYVRGIFDGDGCIYDINGYPVINFSSTSDDLLYQLIDIFKSEVSIELQTKLKQPQIHGIQVAYSCNNAMKILKWMYEKSTYLTRLDRKYNKYLSYTNKQYEKIKYCQNITLV